MYRSDAGGCELCIALNAGGCGGRTLCSRAAGGDALWAYAALELLEVMRCVLLWMLDVMESLRHVLEPLEMMRCVLLWMLDVMESLRHVLEPVEVMRCVLLYMPAAMKGVRHVLELRR